MYAVHITFDDIKIIGLYNLGGDVGGRKEKQRLNESQENRGGTVESGWA